MVAGFAGLPMIFFTCEALSQPYAWTEGVFIAGVGAAACGIVTAGDTAFHVATCGGAVAVHSLGGNAQGGGERVFLSFHLNYIDDSIASTISALSCM